MLVDTTERQSGISTVIQSLIFKNGVVGDMFRWRREQLCRRQWSALAESDHKLSSKLYRRKPVGIYHRCTLHCTTAW
eukprot:1645146-Pyramimonas_sp.AAC.1